LKGRNFERNIERKGGTLKGRKEGTLTGRKEETLIINHYYKWGLRATPSHGETCM
jgi:hypothetical protein